MNTSVKNSPVVAKIKFKDGNIRHWAGNRFEKECINTMVYNLRKACLKNIKHISEIQIYDNTRQGDRLIFEFSEGINKINLLPEYLGTDYLVKN